MERMTTYKEALKISMERYKELEEENKKLSEENGQLKEESEELKIWLREKLPLALLKEYMEKFEGVDLKNI